MCAPRSYPHRVRVGALTCNVINDFCMPGGLFSISQIRLFGKLMNTIVKSFRGVCPRCSLSFALPCLSDFSYGTFLFTRTDGKAYRLFEAIEHPISKLVASKVNAEIVVEIASRLADRDEWLGFTTLPVCPRCKFHEIVLDDSMVLSELSISAANFSVFESLSFDQQMTEISHACEGISSSQK